MIGHIIVTAVLLIHLLRRLLNIIRLIALHFQKAIRNFVGIHCVIHVRLRDNKITFKVWTLLAVGDEDFFVDLVVDPSGVVDSAVHLGFEGLLVHLIVDIGNVVDVIFH